MKTLNVSPTPTRGSEKEESGEVIIKELDLTGRALSYGISEEDLKEIDRARDPEVLERYCDTV